MNWNDKYIQNNLSYYYVAQFLQAIAKTSRKQNNKRNQQKKVMIIIKVSGVNNIGQFVHVCVLYRMLLNNSYRLHDGQYDRMIWNIHTIFLYYLFHYSVNLFSKLFEGMQQCTNTLLPCVADEIINNYCHSS